MDTYLRSTTIFCCNNWSSKKVQPTCGVKQGDPMSPIIFNMIIDRMIKKLPEDIGTRIRESTINAAAFADDLLLFATTPMDSKNCLTKSLTSWANVDLISMRPSV